MTKSETHIERVEAFPSSFPVRNSVSLGIGRAVKRDTVVVKVTTRGGLIGWGESHHGRCPTAVADIVNTTLRQLVVGMDAVDVVGVWARIYQKQLASHGMGAASCMAMSGIDMALWDIRGKVVGWPLYKLLGGSARAIPAYAGGISLGYQEPAALSGEVSQLVAQGYKAVKLRLGDGVRNDALRVRAVRKAFPELKLMTDANTGYSVADARAMMPILDECGVEWLEEPFPPHDFRSYGAAVTFGRTPLAAGENHFARFEFARLIEDKAITVVQPDLSKTGGITEALRIAAMASAYKLTINPHTSATGLNMAASIHFLAAIDNPGFYEADVARENLFRDELTSGAGHIDKDGDVRPPEGPGLGVEVNEPFLRAHPVIEGPAYV
jgi:D-galactarolactone cycloisomerase